MKLLLLKNKQVIASSDSEPRASKRILGARDHSIHRLMEAVLARKQYVCQFAHCDVQPA